MGSGGVTVAFEAKVLLDGVCIAGITFKPDAAWPQIIDHCTGASNNKNDQLRFPPFHSEMLSQAWVIPGQAIGRIKIVIAEGTHPGALGTSPFEVTRNVVAFSFLHTPLHILEDAGIAWPNAGMFYQALNQSWNPLSPRKTKESDPNSHAHSPRGHSQKAKAAVSDLSSQNPPQAQVKRAPSVAFSRPDSGYEQVLGHDPFLAPHSPSSNDPFIGRDTYRNTSETATSELSSSKDIAMVDRPAKSHTSSSDRDQSMPDYSRTASPVSSYQSHSKARHPREVPSTMIARSRPKPGSPRAQSSDSEGLISGEALFPNASRAVSFTSPSGPDMTYDDDGDHSVQQGTDHDDYAGQMSQFAEMMAAVSPPNRHGSGVCGPPNTRLNSAANTPPRLTITRTSAAADARALSYSAIDPSVLVTTQNPIHGRSQSGSKFSHRSTSSAVLGSPAFSHREKVLDSKPNETEDDSTPKADKAVRATAAMNIKGKKEGRQSDSTSTDNTRARRKVAMANNGSDKENFEEVDFMHLAGADNKRRRVSHPHAMETAPTSRARSGVKEEAHTTESGNGFIWNSSTAREPLGLLDNMT